MILENTQFAETCLGLRCSFLEDTQFAIGSIEGDDGKFHWRGGASSERGGEEEDGGQGGGE